MRAGLGPRRLPAVRPGRAAAGVGRSSADVGGTVGPGPAPSRTGCPWAAASLCAAAEGPGVPGVCGGGHGVGPGRHRAAPRSYRRACALARPGAGLGRSGALVVRVAAFGLFVLRRETVRSCCRPRLVWPFALPAGPVPAFVPTFILTFCLG